MYPFLEESLFLVGIMLSILFFRMQRLSVKIEISHYLLDLQLTEFYCKDLS